MTTSVMQLHSLLFDSSTSGTIISEPGSETYTINKRSLQYGVFLMLTSKCILVSTEGQTLFWITRFL